MAKKMALIIGYVRSFVVESQHLKLEPGFGNELVTFQSWLEENIG
jgi:hypothetical protein